MGENNPNNKNNTGREHPYKWTVNSYSEKGRSNKKKVRNLTTLLLPAINMSASSNTTEPNHQTSAARERERKNASMKVNYLARPCINYWLMCK